MYPISAVHEAADKMTAAGAEILDIGARSTAPNSQPISVSEEVERIRECLRQLNGEDYVVSIDTIPRGIKCCSSF